MSNLIRRVLAPFGNGFAADKAVRLVLATGLVESNYKYITQLNNGPAKGFWQVEPDTALDNCISYLAFRPDLLGTCSSTTYVPIVCWDGKNNYWEEILESNIAAGIVHCRLKYRRVQDPLPGTIEEMAEYWKKFYNTTKGAGDTYHFIKICKEMI